MTILKIKKQKVWVVMLLQQYVITNIKIYFWILNVWDIQWIEFKVNTTEYKLMQPTKFDCLVLMTKYTSKAMDMMDYLLVTRVITI